MSSKIKNIIIFVIIAIVIILAYVFFFSGNQNNQAPLISSDVPSLPVTTGVNTNIANVNLDTSDNDVLSQNFLSLLLGVKSITLDDSIFKDGSAFYSLIDSSISLVQDGNEGRSNPFAPIGTDINTAPVLPPAGTTTPENKTTTPSTNPVNKPN